MSDLQNTHGTTDAHEEPDTASGGAPDDSTSQSTSKSTDEVLEDETTDEDGAPLENPSGG